MLRCPFLARLAGAAAYLLSWLVEVARPLLPPPAAATPPPATTTTAPADSARAVALFHTPNLYRQDAE